MSGGSGFERLLALLAEEPRAAERAYERLRNKLIRLFQWRGCAFPEDLADETLSRVAQRLGEGVEIETGDPMRYCCGVAFRVFQEHLREVQRQRRLAESGAFPAVVRPGLEERGEERLECLESCLGELSEPSRRLILEYYQGERRHRIENRKRLARELAIPQRALRLRAHRVRVKVEGCVRQCLATREAVA